MSAVPDVLLSERRGRVLVLTFNRPDRLNAWTGELERRYYEALVQAENDPGVGAVVITGAGRGFCAGADMDDLEQAGKAGDAGGQGAARSFPLAFRKPLIAAVNGAAIGVGLVQALYCDVRFASSSAKLSTVFARRGLIAEYGSSWLLTQIVGRSVALDLLLSGRIITGQEARELGVVHQALETADVLDAAIAYASDIAENCSPTSAAVIKAQVNSDAHSDIETAILQADIELKASFGRPDVNEGVASFVERRTPQFPALDSSAAERIDPLEFLRTNVVR